MTDFINPNEETRVSEGSKVELHFSVCIENGVEIDNTRSREEPVSLPPEDAFGPWNPENVQQFDTVKFEQRPIEGHMIEFEDKAKQSLYGVVKTVGDDITEVDFNHPLAGKDITFEVEIFKVTPAGQQGIKIM